MKIWKMCKRKECGNPFEPRTFWQKYCSTVCRVKDSAYYKDRLVKQPKERKSK